MDDTDTESAETEPLVRHGRTTTTTTTTTTGVGGGTTPGAGGSGTGPPSSRKGGPSYSAPPPPRTPSRHHLEAKPRLSLVPETNERSTEEEQEEAPAEGEEAKKEKKKNMESPTPLCPFFGVKNYLHQFYEKQDIKDPNLYEDLQPDEQIYLVKQTDGGCSSSVFRLSLILGGLLLLLGVVAFIVAACAARRTILINQAGGVSVVDKVASSHNAQVDALLLVGLVAVTLGSTVVAAALISRTFCTRPEEYPYPFRAGHYIIEPPLSPIERKVPATEKLTQVQPVWGNKGLIPLP